MATMEFGRLVMRTVFNVPAADRIVVMTMAAS